jgi:hypothetical protein
VNDLELTNTGVFKAIGTPHLPPGPLMVAEAACSAAMLETDRIAPMSIGHFTDERIAQIQAGEGVLSTAEREFLVNDTPRFEECGYTAAELERESDSDLMRIAYETWADYASTLR